MPHPGWWTHITQGPSMWAAQGAWIIDYTGWIMHECASADNGYAAAIINIEAQREFRINSKFSNFMNDLRVEPYKLIYDALMAMGGIYLKNLAMKEPPRRHTETDTIFAK